MDGEWTEGDAAGRARDGAIDLPDLLRAIARRKWRMIIPTCAAFALALAAVVVLPARYTGVAKVLLENQESYYTRPDKAGAEQAPTLDAEAVQSEAETITSPDLARKAIAKLDLANRPEFNQAAATNPLSVALSLLKLGGSPPARSGEARIVDAFLSRLVAFPVAKTRVLQIEFVSEDPELAARGANVVAQLFLEAQATAKQDEARAASAWLAGKIDELRGKVAEADAKTENYRAQSGLLAGANNMTVPGQQLADLNAQMAAARSAQSAALAKAQLLRSWRRNWPASTARYALRSTRPRVGWRTIRVSPRRRSTASTRRWPPSRRPSRRATSTRCSCARWNSTRIPPAISSNPTCRSIARRSRATPTMRRPPTRG
jgi:uncharacterized protein involved in exopolysaccharide biosynthesis